MMPTQPDPATPATDRPDPLASATLAQRPRVRYGEGAVIACDGLVRIYKLADLEVVALQGLDLAFYTGSGSNPIAVPWLAPVLFAVGVAALAMVFVILAGVRMRRARLDQVLRIGER